MKTLLRLFLLLVCLAVVAIALTVFIFKDRRPGRDKWLCSALETGNTNYLERYLKAGGGVNRHIRLNPRQGGSGPLLDVAIAHGQWATVDFLLKNGANANERDSAGHTPLSWAMGAGSWELPPERRAQICKRLLLGGADLTVGVSHQAGYTPLHEAAFLGEPEIVSILLAAGASVTARNSEGLTPLNFAANAEVALLLIAAGADPLAKAGGETPAESAIRFGHLSTLAVLTNAPRGANSVRPVK